MLKEKLTNLKKKKIWFLFLLYCVNPFYTFIWKNIINLHGRILYFIWFIKKRECIDLSKENLLKVENSKSFQLLSEQVNRACTPEILNLASKNIFDLNKSTKSLFKKYTELIFEPYIGGQEIQVAVINGASLRCFRRKLRTWSG